MHDESPMKHLACVVGARPNFMKMAPILRALRSQPDIRPVLIHTGQHYDAALSDVFFEELDMPRPDVSLEVGSGSHGKQTALILERMEQTLVDGPPDGGNYDHLVVVGDVNSTVASALAAAKLGIPVAHVEAGLRSWDRSMPEEINRIVTDSISDMLFVSEPAGVENLKREGHGDDEIHLVGNVMIDTLHFLLPRAQDRPILTEMELEPRSYGFVTLHRPSNVDDARTLGRLLDALVEIAAQVPLVFPMHPRTQARVEEFNLGTKLDQRSGLIVTPPLGYLDCLCLTSQARLIITDSGGLQEESTALEVPCVTMRENTERPITVTAGTSTLAGNSADVLAESVTRILTGTYKRATCPSLWDGHAAERTVEALSARLLK